MEHGFKKFLNHHPGGFVYGTRIQEGPQSPSWWVCLWNTDSRRFSITILVDLFLEHGFKKDLNHHPGGFVYGTRIKEVSQSPSWWICLWNTDSRWFSITILVDLFMEHKKGQEGSQSPSWWIFLWNTDSRRFSITILVDLVMKHGFKKELNHHPGGFVYGTRIQEGCQSSSWWICLWNTDSRRVSITILVDLFMEHEFKKDLNHPGGFVYGTRIKEVSQSPSWWICLWNTDSRRVSITILVDLFMVHEFKKDLNHHPGGFV